MWWFGKKKVQQAITGTDDDQDLQYDQWISNHMPSKVWDEITYPFLNFNGCTVEV